MNIKKQNGAAILVVLAMLLVITLLGVTAVRMGLTSLSISVNSQVSALVFQAADTGHAVLEQRVTSNPGAASLPSGAIGPSLITPGVEKNYCVTKDNRFKTGNCAAGDFTSERAAMLNQLAVTVPADATGEPRKVLRLGHDPSAGGGVSSYQVVVHSTAVLPVFGTADSDEIEGCLKEPADDSSDPAVETVTDCLTDEGAVFNTQVQEYSYGF